jgi:esterase/lipase
MATAACNDKRNEAYSAMNIHDSYQLTNRTSFLMRKSGHAISLKLMDQVFFPYSGGYSISARPF